MSGNKKSSSSMNLETASSNTYNKHRRSSDVTSPLLTPKNKVFHQVMIEIHSWGSIVLV